MFFMIGIRNVFQKVCECVFPGIFEFAKGEATFLVVLRFKFKQFEFTVQ